MPTTLDIRSGLYYDSVALMQVSAQVKATEGVDAALIGMGTELNVGLMRDAGFDIPDSAAPNDLVIAISASDEAALASGLAAVDEAFTRIADTAARSLGPTGAEQPPLTVESAVGRTGSNLVVVSVPGDYAGIETIAALDAGNSVLLFSDNVDVDTEVALKHRATEAGLIVMGPDCGTAIVAGAGLGFANEVKPGRIGIVAASGTGAQQVSTLLDAAGAGISQLIGTGGRDLAREVGGLSAKQALKALAGDKDTDHVIIVSKPADAEVVAEIEVLAADLGIGVSWAVLGPERTDLTASVETALDSCGFNVPTWPSWGTTGSSEDLQQGPLVGLFCGGTMADEAMLIAAETLGPITSNIPLGGAEKIAGAELPTSAHTVIDFGDDGMTQGRAHPMIDPSLRLGAIAEAGNSAGVLLLDLVLGHGAHAAPAEGLSGAISAARLAATQAGRELPVIVSLIGTQSDPQDFSATVGSLVGAGAEVYVSNAQATRRAVSLIAPLNQAECDNAPAQSGPSSHGAPATTEAAANSAATSDASARSDVPATKLSELLSAEPKVVSVGLSLFADALRAQAVPVVEVPWQPPVGDANRLFSVMSDPRRLAANAQALEAMLNAGAQLVGLRPARECLGLAENEFLHSGPPLEFERASGPMRGALAGAVVFEGLTDTLEEAEAGLADGRFSMAPCHSKDAVGPMAGVISPSMWMFELIDPVYGNRAYCSLNEGLGKVLRYGANNDEVLDRLHWMRDILGPVLAQAVAAHGPIDTKYYVSQMLASGDEGHNRNRTATLLFLRDLMPDLLALDFATADLAEVCSFLGANDYFALNLVMPTCKLAMAAAKGIPGSSLVVTMARNGTDFGIQLSGTGDEWFTGPAQVAEGLYLGDFGPEDANPDIGDSAITETAGIGGLAMAAAPAVVRLVGGDVAFAVETTRRMYEITAGEHPIHQIPILEFRGVPSGIDLVKVLRTNVLPQINTGMAGRIAGVGQVGAGLVNPPMDCFTNGLESLGR